MYVSYSPHVSAACDDDILGSLLSDMMSMALWHQEAAPRNSSGGARQYEEVVAYGITARDTAMADNAVQRRLGGYISCCRS